MELLTTMRFQGTDRIEAWCPQCHSWIGEVEMILDCHPYQRDYIICPSCHTGIARSEAIVGCD